MTDEGYTWVDLEKALAELDSPEGKLRVDGKNHFTREALFTGLVDRNTGFDSDLICHVSPADFLVVIDRCEEKGVRINGVEVFTSDVEPPHKVGLVDVVVSPMHGHGWARELVLRFIDGPDFTICATFEVPGALLDLNPTRDEQPGDEKQSG